MGTTEAPTMTNTKLKRIAWLSKQDPGKAFECLMHLINRESLQENFHQLDGKKANVETVIDIDLKNFFGTINHQLLEDILRYKIKDTRFIRYINRMFKAGVLADGEFTVNEDGVPQGGLCEASHNPPYAKEVVMRSNLLNPLVIK